MFGKMNKSYKAKAHVVLFWDVTPYSFVNWYRRLAATWHLSFNDESARLQNVIIHNYEMSCFGNIDR